MHFVTNSHVPVKTYFNNILIMSFLYAQKLILDVNHTLWIKQNWVQNIKNKNVGHQMYFFWRINSQGHNYKIDTGFFSAPTLNQVFNKSKLVLLVIQPSKWRSWGHSIWPKSHSVSPHHQISLSCLLLKAQSSHNNLWISKSLNLKEY